MSADQDPTMADLVYGDMQARLIRGLAICDLPPLEWIVDGILPAPGLGLLYGPPKSGKSFAAIDLACSVATGRAWMGRQCKPGVVLYIVGEGKSGVGQRAQAWADYNGAQGLENLVWHPGPVQLTDLAQSTALETLAHNLKPSLVIVDTLARCAVGMEENSAKDMGIVVSVLDRIRNASGGTVLVVHHTGKDKTAGARGSTALTGAVDVGIETTGGDRVTLRVALAKDAEDGHAVTYAKELVGASLVLVEGASPARERKPAHTDEVLQALTDAAPDEGLGATAWRLVSEVPESTFYRCRKWLLDHHHVANVGTEKQPRYIVRVGDS